MASENSGSSESRVASRKFALLLATSYFLLALALRFLNLPYAFESGKPVISPIDELYHWKRISFSARHFPQVLEFDSDRGDGGAFCPWPPLYDLAAGGAARLLGGRDDDGVLARAVWFPPVVFAAFVAAAVAVLVRACGAFTAMVAGAALAASPFLVTASWIGAIDHHFLEPILTFAILGSTLLAAPFGFAQGRRGSLRLRSGQARFAGLALGAALVAAMFVQTALIIAAALAFVVLFFRSDGRAGAVGFAIAAIAIAVYRLTRADGYPNSEWFLGWTHAALFAGAAVALECGSLLPPWKAAARRRTVKVIGLLLGALVVLPVVPRLVEGAHFLGGDPWLRTIVEFQPLWRARGEDLLSIVFGLGAGAVFVWPLALRSVGAGFSRHRPAKASLHTETTVALFAIVYLLLTITSRRFWIVAIPLLALAGAMYSGKRVVLALLVAVPPALQLAGWLMTPQSPVKPAQRRWVEIAEQLRRQPPGRVLAPWPMGHALDVLGRHAVVIDNFGSMPDPALFDAANAALAGKDLERFCREHRVRYVIRSAGVPPDRVRRRAGRPASAAGTAALQ